jgi:hypothetical protein
MTEQELRALVRQAIARHAAAAPGSGGRVLSPPPSVLSAFADRRSSLASGSWLDPAHAMFVVPTGADADGPCIIEPAVMCNHCGYCRSMGH